MPLGQLRLGELQQLMESRIPQRLLTMNWLRMRFRWLMGQIQTLLRKLRLRLFGQDMNDGKLKLEMKRFTFHFRNSLGLLPVVTITS